MDFLTVKDTPFSKNRILNCGSRLLDLSEPCVMGILNITPDSFYDGGKYQEESAILARAGEIMKQGGKIVDIGAVSTRPGSTSPDEETERQLIVGAVRLLRKHHPDVLLSVDTYRASVAREAVNEGADIVNDISGGTMDAAMAGLMKHSPAAYVLMHIKGTPENMQQDPHYEDVTCEVAEFFRSQLELLDGKENVILDPGFGFGKNVHHNYRLLHDLEALKLSGYPILAGVSRKSMINRVLGTTPTNALNGTTVINTISLLNGADILRVHDVKEAVECIKLVNQYKLSAANP